MWPFKPKDTVESIAGEIYKTTQAVCEVLREYEYCVSPQDRYSVLVHHIGYMNNKHGSKRSLEMLRSILDNYVVPNGLH